MKQRSKMTIVDSEDCRDHILKGKVGSLVRTRTQLWFRGTEGDWDDDVCIASGEILCLVKIEAFEPDFSPVAEGYLCWWYDFFFLHDNKVISRMWNMNFGTELNLDTMFEVIEL